MEIVLIRHTTPDVAKGICYGQTDLSLADDFETSLTTIREKLLSVPDAIYTSPLFRCNALARRLASTTNVPVVSDPRLMELNFGRWEMKPWDDIDAPALMQWMNNYEHERCPDGESYRDLIARVQYFIDYLKSTGHQVPWVVTHGGVIRAFHVIARGMPLRESMNLSIPYGNVISMAL